MEITTTILWYIITMAAGGAFVIAYQHYKFINYIAQRVEDEYDEDENDYNDTEVVSVNGKYYEIPTGLADTLDTIQIAMELMASDLEKKQPKSSKNKKSAYAIKMEYLVKAEETKDN